jgi:hypothetical protein
MVKCGLLGILVVLVVACQASASASAKVNTGDKEKTNEPEPEPATSAAPAATPAAPDAPPPATECPITCVEAAGPVTLALTQAEATAANATVAPILGKMRTCSSPEEWRRFGSPIVHLRIAADGAIAEVDVDPHHGHRGSSGCYSDAAHDAKLSGSFPGRKTLRCRERCAPEKGAAPAPRKRRGRGR